MRIINGIRHQKPTAESLSWVESIVGAQINVEKISMMQGGTSSLVFEIPFIEESLHDSLILRLFHKKDWLAVEPDLAKHEGDSLQRAASAMVPSPDLIAFDESGEACGMPVVLMTKLSGEIILQPEDMGKWLEGMAETLVKIHQMEAGNFSYEYFSYNTALNLEKPLWSRFPEAWQRAFFIVAGVRPPVQSSFIHRDYHPANVLWKDEEITGVVDWVNACRGPAGIDVGHCRVNLAQLCGVSVADEFLEAYKRHAGTRFQYDPYWDLVSLADTANGPPKVYGGWTALGVTGLSDDLIRHRLDEFLLTLLDRFDN